MQVFPKISRMGEQAILLQFEPEISEKVLKKVLVCQKILQEKFLKGGVEVINTYHSLLVTYPDAIENAYDGFLQLKEELELAKILDNFKSHLFHIPVCYDEKFGVDLDEISEAKELQKREIIRLHSTALY
ncbi:carboxyltransferase domain-containing protein, partial [Salinimicrobium oceani]